MRKLGPGPPFVILRRSLLSTCAVAIALACAAPSHAAIAVKPLSDAIPGTWKGAIAGRIPFILHVERGTNGALKATADSPSQNATGLEVDQIETRGDSLVFFMNSIHGWYGGVCNDLRTEIRGTWYQGTAAVPLTLTYAKPETNPPADANLRPQNPKPPFPYDAIDVKYENPKAKGVTLAGTLTVPKGATKAPCAILITGSGPEDRDETIFGHKPFLVLADYLTRHGIAVLRSDDRGIGGSTGDLQNATSDDFAGDVEAAIAFLKTRKEIDPLKIGLIGHSEGGLIGPMVAARHKGVAFVVMLAGPGVPGDEILIRQSLKISLSMGFTTEQAEAAQNAQRDLITAAKDPTDSTAFVAKLKTVIQAQIDQLPYEQKKDVGDVNEIAVGQAKILRAPWMKFFLNYDPRHTLAQVTCPVLALNGEKDIQVDADQNLPEIRAALTKGGNKDATVEKLPGLNHLFQTVEMGSIDEYARTPETFAPTAMQKISDWIGARMGRGK